MKKNRLKNAASRNRYSLLAFGATAFVMLIVYYCFSVIPFGDYTVLRMDMYHQYGPLFAELYDRITMGKSLVYSWTTGLGGSFLGNFGNYLASPFAIVMLLLGHKNMPEAIAIMILLKAAFASAFFSWYLRKTTGKNDFTVSAFGVLYSFCGFFIAYYWNIMWIDAMALFPIVMYGIEQIIRRGKFGTYLFSLAAVMVTNYYMAYIICLFSVIYFLFYYLSAYSLGERLNTAKYVDENGEKVKLTKAQRKEFGGKNGGIKAIGNSRFINSGLRFAFASVCAACLAAFMLLPLYFILKSCSATSGTFPAEYRSYFKIFDFIANHLVSLEPTIRSSGDDVLPNIYCGMVTVLLAPLYLYSKSYSIREKVCYCALLGIMFVSFNINMLNYIWHGFHFPNDLPYRLSYIYSFLLLVMAYKALIHIKDFTPKMLLTVGVAVVAFVVFAEKIGSKNVSEDTVIISIIFAIFYVFVLVLMRSGKYQASAVALLLFCGIVSEAAVGNTSHYSMSQQKKYFVGDYDDFQTVKEEIDSREKTGFYRMELTDLRARMDPSWYNYNGVSIFSSMAYEKTSNLVHYLGMDGNVINSYTYNGFQTPVFNMMTSLKYIVNNIQDYPTPSKELYEPVTKFDKFDAYQNNYELSLGYGVNKAILGWDYDNSNPFTVQNDYFKCATGIEDVFSQVIIDRFDYDNISEIPIGYDTGSLTFFRDVDDVDASFTACYEIKETKEYFIYINSSNVEDVVISYGDVSFTHNFSSEHIIGIGKIEEGDTLYVNVPIHEGNSGYVDMYMCGMDMEKFTEGYSMLEKAQLKISSFDETKIVGKATVAEDCVFYTSIPYDESWQITVDGKRVSVEEMQECKIGDGFIGFNLSRGTHDIEFNYHARGLRIGVAVSAATAVLLLLVFVFLKKLRLISCVTKGYEDTAVIDTYVIPSSEPVGKADESELPENELSLEHCDEPETVEESTPVAEESETTEEINSEDSDNKETES